MKNQVEHSVVFLDPGNAELVDIELKLIPGVAGQKGEFDFADIGHEIEKGRGCDPLLKVVIPESFKADYVFGTVFRNLCHEIIVFMGWFLGFGICQNSLINLLTH
jgi:hypothetical protein